MAVTVITTNPRALLAAMKEKIDGGAIETWSYDEAGDFTHAVAQWKNLAWMRPRPGTDRVEFIIVGREGIGVSAPLYAVYHGRFIELLLAQFDTLFSRASASALATSEDLVSS